MSWGQIGCIQSLAILTRQAAGSAPDTIDELWGVAHLSGGAQIDPGPWTVHGPAAPALIQTRDPFEAIKGSEGASTDPVKLSDHLSRAMNGHWKGPKVIKGQPLDPDKPMARGIQKPMVLGMSALQGPVNHQPVLHPISLQRPRLSVHQAIKAEPGKPSLSTTCLGLGKERPGVVQRIRGARPE